MIRNATIFCLAVGILASSGAGRAVAGEADDLQRMSDGARKNVTDLELRDERLAVRDELAMQRTWLDLAWRMRSEQKYDEVRIVVDRCEAQAEMIRQKIAASNLLADAAAKEADLKRAKEEIGK